MSVFVCLCVTFFLGIFLMRGSLSFKSGDGVTQIGRWMDRLDRKVGNVLPFRSRSKANGMKMRGRLGW